jgi:hypothetical protein
LEPCHRNDAAYTSTNRVGCDDRIPYQYL